MFKALILIDNNAQGALLSEWGLAVYIEYGGKKYLLDTGASGLCLQNAEKLGIDIRSVDTAVLSHAHYDHSGGYKSFFSVNGGAKLYLAASSTEDCYFKLGPVRKRIGIPRGVLDAYGERIVRTDGFLQIDEGVYLVPHLKNNLEAIGKKAHMFRRVGGRLIPDDFSHEQSLVFETEKGLVVLNSCSHGGLENILKDIAFFLPKKRVYMTIGGLHLSGAGTRTVEGVAETIKSLSIEKVVTGHCTGKKAYEILKKELGEKLCGLYAGMTIEV